MVDVLILGAEKVPSGCGNATLPSGVIYIAGNKLCLCGPPPYQKENVLDGIRPEPIDTSWPAIHVSPIWGVAASAYL